MDRLIPALMARWNIPGGAVAVMDHGRLVAARGYGWADVESRRPVDPTSLFRIASLSKPITAAAIMLLVEQGRLDLDQKVFALLGDPLPPRADPRLATITVRELLHHAGGWDRQADVDPVFVQTPAGNSEGSYPDAGEIIRNMESHPLQFNPGTRYCYSNFGYLILGRIIERVTGQSYASWVGENILAPAGIHDMTLGSTARSEHRTGEVTYYQPDAPDSPYHGIRFESTDAAAGWIGSAVDMARFAAALDGDPLQPDLLRPSTLREMVARPLLPIPKDGQFRYGMGWAARPAGAGFDAWHDGTMPGSSAILFRSHDGMCWVALFNSRPADADAFFVELDSTMRRAAGLVRQAEALHRVQAGARPLSSSSSARAAAGVPVSAP